MIIIRPEETQSLPTTKHRAQAQYSGQGQEFIGLGNAMTSVGNRGTAVALQYAALEDKQAKQFAHDTVYQANERWHQELDQFVNDPVDGWDKQHVQNGESPTETLKAYQKRLHDMRDEFQEYYSNGLDSNKYLSSAFGNAWDKFESEAMIKGRAHANKGFLEVGRKNFDMSIEATKQRALHTEASEGYEAYKGVQTTIAAQIESGGVNYYNPTERKAYLKHTMEDLEAKRGLAFANRAPEEFLTDLHTNPSHYDMMDPKVLKELESTAEVSLGRKVAAEDHKRKVLSAEVQAAATELKNDLLSQAQAGNPSGAINRALTARNLLGTEFDNTLTTLRTMAKGENNSDDPTTLAELTRRIDHNPGETVYKDVEKAFQTGKLTNSTFTRMTARNTERAESLRDKAKAERHQRTNQAITDLQPLLNTASIMDFDKAGNDYKAMFESELRARIEANPKLDPMTEGPKVLMKYRNLIEDRNEGVFETLSSKYGFKSPDEVIQAYKSGKISRLESDFYLEMLKKGETAKPKPTTSAQSSSILKKK